MSKNNSVESSTQSPSKQLLNPALQAALGSLDVRLEEELTRYRRKRAGRPVKSARGLGGNQVRQPIELISIEKPVAQTQQPALQASSAPVVSLPQAPEFKAPPTVLPQEMSQELMSQTEQLEESSLVASELPESSVDKSLVAQSEVNEQLTPSEETTEEPNLASSELPQEQPEDYLESSEKLLESLREEEASTQPQKSFTSQLLTPLGVGLVLLVLLSGATVAYIAMNPSQFRTLVLDRLFGSKETTTAQNSIGRTPANGESDQDSPIINGPDLASEEFVDLNLNNLSRLEGIPDQTPTPTQIEAPPLPDLPNSNTTSREPSGVSNQAPSGGTDLPSALLPPPPLPGTAPQTAKPPATANNPKATPAQPSPSPSTTVPVITPEASPSVEPVEAAAPPSPKDRLYYVLTNYTGNQALVKAQTVVPDAYLRKFPEGTRIQMGAFEKEAQAKGLVEQLQQQGISASVYQTQE